MPEREPEQLTALRYAMVEQIGVYAGLIADRVGKECFADPVMAAMAKVPRHAFVPVELVAFAYEDSPLPIGCGKTISQPFIVALMTDLLDVSPGDKVLEVGTGLGYQAAILAELGAQVYSVEIIQELADQARKRLGNLGYDKVHLRVGDGNQGWPEHAPFDKVIATAAPELIPPALLTQLKGGGRMVIPAGLESAQQLLLVERNGAGKTTTKEILSVVFSRMVTSH